MQTLDDEEVIGVYTARTMAEKVGDNIRTFYCPNCTKRVHCRAGIVDGTYTVEMIKDRCNNDKCECKCRRYYSHDGILYKYGTKLPTGKLTSENESSKRNFTDDLIDNFNKMNKEFTK